MAVDGTTVVVVLLVLVSAVTTRVVPHSRTCHEEARRVINYIYGGKFVVPCSVNVTTMETTCHELPLDELRTEFPGVIHSVSTGGMICPTNFVVSKHGGVHVKCPVMCRHLHIHCQTISVACYSHVIPRTLPPLPK